MKNLLKHIFIAALLASIVCASSYLNSMYHIDNLTSDTIYQEEQALDGNIIVLGIDVKALTEYGPFNSWGRNILAELIETLNSNPDSRPAVIGFDVMFFGESTAKNDKLLVDAAKRYNNVVVASSATFKSSIVTEANGDFYLNDYTVETIENPFPELKAVTKQGLINTMPDEDGVVRHVLHYLEIDNNETINSFGYEVYKMYAEKSGLPPVVNPPSNSRHQWYIPFSAKHDGYSDGFSVRDVLNGDVPSELFADSIVLIGPYAPGMMDAYVTAIDRSTPMFGVELHANVIDALIHQNFKQTLPVAIQMIISFTIIFLSYFAFKKIKPKFSPLLLLLLISGFLFMIYLLNYFGYMMNIVYIPIGLIILFIIWIILNYMNELWEKKKITDNFKKYVAPDLVDQIIQSGDSLVLGGQRRNIACMFIDIRGFTPMSEALEPEELVEILNSYLNLTCTAIFAHNGTLDKFIGDATMALFNAPLDLDDYIYRSILTAWDIISGGDELNYHLEEKFGQSVSFGIGLTCGPAVVGNIGTQYRMDYTAIGDTVNTASRLEALAKPGQVLMSEAVYEAVKDRISAIYLGNLALKGKSNHLHVYGLLHVNEYPDTPSLDSAYSLQDFAEILDDD